MDLVESGRIVGAAAVHSAVYMEIPVLEQPVCNHQVRLFEYYRSNLHLDHKVCGKRLTFAISRDSHH